MNGDAMLAGTGRTVAHIEYDPVRRHDAAKQTVDPRAVIHNGRKASKLVQHCQADRLQDKPGADRCRCRRLVEYLNPVTAPGQKSRSGKTGDAGSSNRN
uniref:Uncharacterized protein n=1 Tax=Aquisalinus luteolus TaxID=1566827 RepID=A0A8J3EPZ5_9PROT|nr:hypothetical protein GCM10011355_03370 [Aquisalinus luteolus]